MVTQAHGIRARLLVAVAVIAGAIAWIGLQLWLNSGHPAPVVSWAALPILLAAAAGLYFSGRPVKQLVAGTAVKPVHPLYAARILALAQAAALTGAVILGWYVAQIIHLLPDADVASQQQTILELGLLGVGAILLSVAGLLVQRMCRLDNDRPDRPGGPQYPGQNHPDRNHRDRNQLDRSNVDRSQIDRGHIDRSRSKPGRDERNGTRPRS